jgi:hypothetical protein
MEIFLGKEISCGDIMNATVGKKPFLAENGGV